MLTPASESLRKAFAPAPCHVSMRIVRAGRSLYSIPAPSSASPAALSIRNREPGLPARQHGFDDVGRSS
jgi:hypothetical protein